MKLRRAHVRAVFGIVGLVFLFLAFMESLDRAQELTFPRPMSLALAFALLVVALIAAGFSWTALFGPESGRGELFGVFFQAQPGKYIPGGIWQAAMQIGFAKSAKVGIGTASVAFLVHSVTQLVAGLALGSILAMVADFLSTAARIAIAMGLLSLLLLHTEWVRRIVQLVWRVSQFHVEVTVIPAQRSIVRSTAWSVLTLVLSGLAFAIVAGHFGITSSTVVLVLTFSLSWALGFLAVPFPAGLGVREGIMIILLGSNAANVIAASLVHRILTMAAEISMLAAVEARARWN